MKIKTIEFHKVDPANLWPSDPAEPASVWRGTIDGVLVANIRGNSDKTFTLNMNFMNSGGIARYPATRYETFRGTMNMAQTLLHNIIFELVDVES